MYRQSSSLVMTADLNHFNLKCKLHVSYVFVALGIFCVVVCTVTNFYNAYNGERDRNCGSSTLTTSRIKELKPVILDVDSLYKRTKVILEKRLEAGQLSSDVQGRILILISNSYNDTAQQITKYLDQTNTKSSITSVHRPSGMQQKQMRKIDEDNKITEMAGLISILQLKSTDLGVTERIFEEINKRSYNVMMKKLG